MEKSINAIRFLGLDMINTANSGHPGIVLGAAPLMYSLYTKQLKVMPTDSKWFDRDRFVLAAGHGSALLYSTLHLAGYALPLEELKRFRQLHSLTPGHPEYRHTEGVDATTGPLGQGIAHAIGMAIAEKYLSHTFNKEGFNIIDHNTYALCGDGDLQEGVTLEALSLAGHLKLEKLIVIFDSNDVQLDGPTDDAVSEDVQKKMESMDWHYQKVDDANDLSSFHQAIDQAKKSMKPSFIEVKSIIGFGSKKQGTSATHGAPIGFEETALMRQTFNYSYDLFEVPADVYEDFKNGVLHRNQKTYENWIETLNEYQKAYPNLYKELIGLINEDVKINFDQVLKPDPIGHKEATRNTIGKIIPLISTSHIGFMGGSADLSGSTKVKGVNGNFTSLNPTGRNINFGVREHAMAAIVNGMTLHHLRGFSGGFFIFSDYMKPSIRLAALMHIPSLYIFTHDSVAVGEDGPTHEPVEQLSMFRTTPNLLTFRPANSNEVKHAIRYALSEKRKPSVIVLTRQDVTVLHDVDFESFSKGAYIASDQSDFDGILIATGSEVELAMKTQAYLLKEKHIRVRVVSMPSMELFKQQDETYRNAVIPQNCNKVLAIELGSKELWHQFTHHIVGLETFGMSAPQNDVLEYFGFTVEHIAQKYLAL